MIQMLAFCSICREELENTNVMFNANDTVSYIPRRKVVAVPEMSIGDPNDMMVIAPNLALLVRLAVQRACRMGGLRSGVVVVVDID